MTTQAELIASCRTRYAQAATTAEELAGPLTRRQVAWSPPDGGWGVAQVLEHLTLSNEQYLKEIRARLDRGPRPRRNAAAMWRPSLAGRLLEHAMVSPRKAKAPRVWTPGPVVRPQPLDGFTHTLSELTAQLDRAADVDLRRTRTRSPVSWLIRLNLGDAFELQALHAERHLGQIHRIMLRPEFPGARAD